MVKPIDKSIPAPSSSPATRKGSKTSYESTTSKVLANAGKITVDSSKASMKGRALTSQASGENLSSLVRKGSGKQRAQTIANVASPILKSTSLANKTKIRSAHIAKSAPKMNAAAKKVLGKSS